MKFTPTEQALIRLDMFRWLDERRDVDGMFEFSRADLAQYSWMGQTIRLCDTTKGIRNPQCFDETLSILSSVDGPYNDLQLDDLTVQYAYEANDRGSNKKLKAAHQNSTPLIYFRGVRRSHFVAHYPVFVTADNEQEETFTITLDQEYLALRDGFQTQSDDRAYIERRIRARVHQPEFRWRVMSAYKQQCAVCELKHVELLDAAHIIPDNHELGLPVVTNGLALCKIHHAAYDRDLLGISPDLEVKINSRLLHEVDGPMLKHGLQEMHGRTLTVPARAADQPARENLDFRFQQFASA